MNGKREHIVLACYGVVFLLLLGLQVSGVIGRRHEILQKRDEALKLADTVSKIKIPTPSMNQGLPADRVYQKWSEIKMTEQLTKQDLYDVNRGR